MLLPLAVKSIKLTIFQQLIATTRYIVIHIPHQTQPFVTNMSD